MPARASSRTAPRTLDALERWFQGEIVRPHERAAAKLRAAPVETVLRPSATLSADERISVYRRMYFFRLVDALESDYQAVAQLAGHERFHELARGYLEAHPSRHYSLNRLGTHFAPFLARQTKVPRHKLLADVAKLEWHMQEVFEAEESPRLSPADVAALPAERWMSARLIPIHALRVAAFDYRANKIATAVRREVPLPPLTRSSSWCAIYRKDWVVWRMDIDRLQFTVLTALLRGRTLAQALSAGAAVYRGPKAKLQSSIHAAFSEWVSEGFFAGVR
jgi:hypothetical protein